MEMDNFKTTIKYWAIVVVWPALKDAFPVSKFGDRIMDIVVSLLIAIGAIVVYGSITRFQGIGVNLTTLVVWLVVTVILRFIYGLIYFPAKSYKDVGGISGNPLRLIPRPPEKSESGTWVVMDVNCKSGFGVSDCVLILKEAISIETPKKSILRSSERLTWSGRSQIRGIKDVADRPGNFFMPIHGMGHEYCDIAQTVENNERAKFTLWHKDNQFIPPGEYEITIEVNGVWGKEPRVGFSAECKFILTYNGGDDLLLRVYDLNA